MITRSKEKAQQAKLLGQRLRNIRKTAGITQVQLAARINATHSSICQYERGIVAPTLPRLQKIANALGTSTDELLGCVAVKDRGQEKRLRLWRRLEPIQTLSRQDQHAVIAFLDSLITQRQQRMSRPALNR